MGKEDGGVSLRGLAERLEALEGENAELRGKVAALEDEAVGGRALAVRKAPSTPARRARRARPSTTSEEAVSRRAMLARTGAAAVAAVAAGTLLAPREAQAATVVGEGAPGVRGIATEGSYGVLGETGPGVSSGVGVVGFGVGNLSSGVSGFNFTPGGVGVDGNGDTGVWGRTSRPGYSGVYGQHNGTDGFGLVGDGKGSGSGVQGRSASGAGVEGRDSRYGGKFAGSRAQLLMVPKDATGRPTSGQHAKGEIYMDSAGALFVCARGGTPGTWRKVTTTSA